MTTALIVIALILLGIVLLRKGKAKPAGTSGWHIQFSPGMPARPTLLGDGWYFLFPTIPTSHVHYVQWFNPPALGTQIAVRFMVTGGGFVPQEFPDRPATVSLLLQRRGDDWSAIGPMAAYRWFSHKVVELAPGEDVLLVVPLDVAEWGDVYGGRDPAAFAATLRDLDNIGLVFGSAGGRGHGVWATQPSQFTLLDINVMGGTA